MKLADLRKGVKGFLSIAPFLYKINNYRPKIKWLLFLTILTTGIILVSSQS